MSTNEKHYDANNVKTVFLVSACLILSALAAVQIFRKSPKSVTPMFTEPITEKVEETTDGMLGKQAFIKKYDNFEQLKLTDLPIFSDVRGVFEYGSNLIVVGSDVIIEYNPETKEIVRTNSTIFPNIFEAVKIDKYLYVGVNAHAVNKNYDEAKTTGEIYKVNLDTGLIEDEFLANKDIPNDLVNVDLATSNGDLWVLGGLELEGSTTYRINPNTKEVLDTYTAADLGFTKPTACNNSFKFAKKTDEIQVVEFACKNFVSTYDYETHTWDIELKETSDASDYINLSKNNFNVDVPYFYVLTANTANGKHYALADTGLYEITKGTLPTKIADAEVEVFTFGHNNLFANKDGSQLVLLSSTYGSVGPGGPNTNNMDEVLLADVFKAYVLDIASGDILDLVANTESLNGASAQPYLENIFKYVENVPSPTYNNIDNEILFYDKTTGDTLVSVDLENQQIFISKE